MFNVIRIPTKFSKTIKRMSNEERLQVFDLLIKIWDWGEISPPDNIVWDVVQLIYGEWMNMEAKNGVKREKSSINLCSEWPGEVVPSDPGTRVEYSRVEENRVEESRNIVPTETKIIKNEYQENISYMRQQADSIRNEILPDIPNFVKQGQEEEWGKFILYWTSPTSKWTIACEEALNWKIKSFDIKRRFSFWLSNKDKQVTNNSYQPKKTTVWVLDK